MPLTLNDFETQQQHARDVAKIDIKLSQTKINRPAAADAVDTQMRKIVLHDSSAEPQMLFSFFSHTFVFSTTSRKGIYA